MCSIRISCVTPSSTTLALRHRHDWGTVRMNGMTNTCWSRSVILLVLVSTVRGQCTYGYESACVWTHDTTAPLRWKFKTGGKERWIEVSGCVHPRCGSAVLQSPWLPPTEREATWMLRHKIYGIDNVRLELSLWTEGSGPRQLFFKKGNYALELPSFWSATKVLIPPTPLRHRLLLQATTPYGDAVVAVSDIHLEGNSPVPIEPTSRSFQDEISPETTEPDEVEKPEVEGEDGREEVNESEDRFETLEANLLGEPDLKKGYTKVMDPNICLYD